MASGRFAPSPTGPLHLGNLRTAVVAWLFARSTDSRFVVRVEDLDPSCRESPHRERQLSDLAALGIDWDGPELYQSTRLGAYRDVIGTLIDEGLTFRCYCSRREVREASLAAHGEVRRYPGTCRELTQVEHRQRTAEGRPAAIRLRADGGTRTFTDRIHGDYSGQVDDVVIQRNDGTPAYNLAVVLDDAEQHIAEVVRGDDLMPSTPAQMQLLDAIGKPIPTYAHVPLVLGPLGNRLAKRDGAVTLADLEHHDITPHQVVGRIAHSLGLVERDEEMGCIDLLEGFDPKQIDWQPWTLTASDLFADIDAR